MNAKREGGMTSFDVAKTEIANLLRKHGGKVGSEKHHISTFQFPV